MNIKTEHNKNNLLAALSKNMCCVAKACNELNISRRIFYEWLNTDSEFKQAYEDTQDKLLDFAESMLLKNIAKGDNQAIMFYLKSKGKKRGYSDKEDLQKDAVQELTEDELDQRIKEYENRNNLVCDGVKKELMQLEQIATDEELKMLLELSQRYKAIDHYKKHPCTSEQEAEDYDRKYGKYMK